jgi:hypothetical protein
MHSAPAPLIDIADHGYGSLFASEASRGYIIHQYQNIAARK